MFESWPPSRSPLTTSWCRKLVWNVYVCCLLQVRLKSALSLSLSLSLSPSFSLSLGLNKRKNICVMSATGLAGVSSLSLSYLFLSLCACLSICWTICVSVLCIHSIVISDKAAEILNSAGAMSHLIRTMDRYIDVLCESFQSFINFY